MTPDVVVSLLFENCSRQGASLQGLPVGARLLPPADSSLERGVRFRRFSAVPSDDIWPGSLASFF